MIAMTESPYLKDVREADQARVRRDDRAHVFHSWSAQGAIDPLPIASAEGSSFTDYDGNRYLDFSSQLVNVNIGYNHPRLIEAIQEQAGRLTTISPAFANDARSEAARLIVEKSPFDDGMVFFTNGGAEATENALRMARLHTGRQKVMAAYRSYHGATAGAIAVTGDPRRWPNEPGVPGVVRYWGPYAYRSAFHAADEQQECERALAHLRDTIMVEGPQAIAAILLETDFIVQKKLKPTLEAVNAGLDTVVKAQIYLRDQEDVPGFRQAWAKHFPVEPATTIIATETPGFIQSELRIEINTIALAKDGATKKQAITPVPPLFSGATTAIRAGDLLFISGLMAVRDGALVPGAKSDPTQPFFAIPAKAELKEILAQAEAICAAAGTSLSNAVRIQQFHSDLADLPATLEVWSEAMDGAPLPLSPVEVPWLPVPGARLEVDLWVYCP